MKLWLDDLRPAPEGWIWCKTGEEFIANLYYWEEKVDEVSMDHDLGSSYETGYDVLTFLESEIAGGHLTFLPKIRVHSANPVGKKKMEQAIESIERLLNESE